jgi:hypothetical protein
VSLFWAGVIFFVVTSNGAANTPARIAVFVAWVAAWSTCVAVGLLDWRRARKVSQQAQDRR